MFFDAGAVRLSFRALAPAGGREVVALGQFSQKPPLIPPKSLRVF